MTASGERLASPAAAVSPVSRFAGAGDARMVAVVRSLLAAAGLLIIWVNPAEPARLSQLTYASLGAYFLYSVALVIIIRRRPALAARRSLLWTDVSFATYLVALTEGTNSIFFFFFFFSILATSFTRGYRDGIIVTLASVAGFILASVIALPHTEMLDVERMLIRPISLLLLGYMMAHWGGFELALKRKLALLGTLQSAANPRQGRDHLILSSLTGLRTFFGADSCVLVVSRMTHPLPVAYRVGGERADPKVSVHGLSDASAPHFQGLAAEPCLYPLPGHSGWRRLFAPPGAESTAEHAAAWRHEAVAHLLDATAMVSGPYLESPGCPGRVFVVARSPRAWRSEDAEFLAQWAGTLAALVNNVTLTDELIAHAADHARRDLSRDLHDMIVQPYVGLRFALEGLLRACPQDLPLRPRIEETVAMAHAAIEQLRTHAAEIRFGKIVTAGALSEALAGQADRMQEFFGVDVRVDVRIDCGEVGGLSGKASTLIHRVVTEGLNNVLRHTTARQALVVIGQDVDALSVEIRNECSAPEGAAFTPQSITDRVTEVGGTVSVRHGEGMTAVLARIPLEVCRAPV